MSEPICHVHDEDGRTIGSGSGLTVTQALRNAVDDAERQLLSGASGTYGCGESDKDAMQAALEAGDGQ